MPRKGFEVIADHDGVEKRELFRYGSAAEKAFYKYQDDPKTFSVHLTDTIRDRVIKTWERP